MEESSWKPVGDLASSILQAATEKREKLAGLKAAVARDHADALQTASGAILVQLELPLMDAPILPQREPRGGRVFRM